MDFKDSEEFSKKSGHGVELKKDNLHVEMDELDLENDYKLINGI